MEQNLQELYNWIDLHEISRPKKNLNRDFSDAGTEYKKYNLMTYVY